jgi:cupin-like protein
VTPIAEYEGVTAARFRDEISQRYEPAVMRGLVRGWPAVQRALAAPDGICGYLEELDSGKPVAGLRTPPSARGRIFYNDNLDGFNYTADQMTVSSVVERMRKYAKLASPASVAILSALVSDCLPGFLAANANPVLDPSIAPRIWIGSHVVTPAHFDESNNVACVVAGRRRFTLFPPQAIADLYIGPIGYAPTGTPISLVDFAEPDLQRFPRFGDALAVAQGAELEPGDAIFIPTLWWHHVESLAKFNVLVNYWWKGWVGATARNDSALDCLLLAILNLRHLPPEQRRNWSVIFDHYVFGADESTASHIPAHKRGVLGEISPELAKQVRAFLISKLQG